ncbi:MAG: branched-chain amino acid ABC transporter substrate-binding protein [Peptococcaceae bacterium]|nr:branched-chain amino acid ABC transporter substrate-binding protein [Peptococcaceae bacterium]
MLKRFLIVLTAMVLALVPALSGCGKSESGKESKQAAGEEIKIGLPLPLTGSEATYGKDMQNAMQLAVDEINAEGGVLGKKITVITGDDACDPQQATAAANKLVSSGVVAIVGGYCSGATIPTLSIYGERNIPFVITAANSSKIAAQNPGIAFQINGTAFHQTQKAVEMFKKVGAKNVAIVNQGDAYSADLADSTKKAWEDAGNKVVAMAVTNKGEQDFSSLITSLLSKNTDLVFWTAYYADGGLLIKQLRAAGYKGSIIVGDGSCDPKLIEIAGPASEGTYVLSPPVAEYLPEAKKFAEAYKAKFNQAPGPYAPLAYDGIKLMASAMKKAGSTDPKAVVKALKETEDFAGIAGKIKFKEDNTLKESNFIVLKVKDGKFTLAD